eukprot:8512072-Pyramimonas_sp.AAC.2
MGPLERVCAPRLLGVWCPHSAFRPSRAPLPTRCRWWSAARPAQHRWCSRLAIGRRPRALLRANRAVNSPAREGEFASSGG